MKHCPNDCYTKKAIEDFFNPQKGGYGQMHEKINKRPTWTVISIIIMILFSLIMASYAYTTRVSDKLESKIEKLVTKEDLNSFSTAVIRAIEDKKH